MTFIINEHMLEKQAGQIKNGDADLLHKLLFLYLMYFLHNNVLVQLAQQFNAQICCAQHQTNKRTIRTYSTLVEDTKLTMEIATKTS